MLESNNTNKYLKKLVKVDKYGKYAPFPGVTVVASCYPEQKEFCEIMYKILINNQLIMEYYSPLPATSYHMTTMSLETEQQKGGSWNDFISRNLSVYRKIIQDLQTSLFHPLVEKMEIRINETISLLVHLPEAQKTRIKQTAQALNLENTVPIFHITLAYPHPNKKISAEVITQLQKEITDKLSIIIAKTTLPMKIAEPKLCYFNDMTAFHPWSAEQNPF